MKLLILGGTTEATARAAALAGRKALAGREALAGRDDLRPVLSLAGRTVSPALPPIPHRIGGFGGVAGLVDYLASAGVEAVIDATHPFAARISAHAVEACAARGVPLLAFTRPPWQPGPGDRWTAVPDLDAAARALGTAPRRVLLTVGRLGLSAFRAAPHHRYVVRTIDPPDPADLPPDHRLVLDRGPFRLAAETALLRDAGIDVLVTKNSGGTAAAAKLDAARALGIAVVAVARPAPAGSRREAFALAEVLAWIDARAHAEPRP